MEFDRRHALRLAAAAGLVPFAPRIASALDYPTTRPAVHPTSAAV